MNWQPVHGYPWQTPVIHPDWPLGPDSALGEFIAANLHRLGGYPVYAVFVAAGAQLIASAMMLRATLIRPGGSLGVQYRARVAP